jgi:hypothetical protein
MENWCSARINWCGAIESEFDDQDRENNKYIQLIRAELEGVKKWNAKLNGSARTI